MAGNMRPEASNRFSFFTKSNGLEKELTPKSDASPSSQVSLLTPSVSNGNPWQEVKGREKGKKRNSILSIRTDKDQNSAIERTRTAGSARRDASAQMILSSSPTSPNENFNPHENFCGVCNIKFPNKMALQNHMKQNPREHQNYCNLCKRVFKDRNGLQNHVDNAFGHDVFCNLCLSAFKDEWGLRNHFENDYHFGHEFACLTCLQGFNSRVDMEVHLKTATKHVWCLTCHRKYKSQEERDLHWAETSKHKHCLQPGCDFDALDSQTLNEHLANDHFQCEGCHLIFQSQTKLNAHYETCTVVVQCDHCRTRFNNSESLAIHERTSCPGQANTFQSTPQLSLGSNFVSNEHSIETTNSSQKCWFCPSMFSSCTHLIKHLETGKCSSCPLSHELLVRTLGKWWYSALYVDLDIHAQIRQGRLDMQVILAWLKEGALTPYICRADGCGKLFGRFSSLVFHMESDECGYDIHRLKLDWLQKEVMAEASRNV